MKYRIVIEQPLSESGAKILGSTRRGEGIYELEVYDDSLFARLRTQFVGRHTLGFCPSALRPKAMFFDMDATVIAEESLVELAATTGAQEAVRAITERAMNGELDFAAALRERVKLLAAQPESIIDVVAARLTVNPGLQTVIDAARAQGVPAFLISGGFMELAEPLARRLGFAAVHANRLESRGGRLTGGLVGTIVDGEEKRRWLLEQCQRLGIGPDQVLAVGDGANDIPMLRTAGLAIGYRPKPVLQPHVHGWNGGGQHDFILALAFGEVGAPS